MSSQDAAVTGPKPLKPTPRWQRWAMAVIGVVLLGTGVLRLVDAFVTRNDLPACDSRRAKDILSDVFKEKKLNPTSYSEVKTTSSSPDLVECQATLPAGDQGILDVQYKFVRNGSDQRIEYTITPKPQ